MSADALKNRWVILSAVAVLLVGGGAWGLTAYARHKRSAVPKEFTAVALKNEQDPGKMFEKVHQAMERTDLTDQQKHAIRENAHDAMESRMEARMNEYFQASGAQKQAVLDRHLNEMVVRMKEMEKRRAEWQAKNGTFQLAGGPGGGPPWMRGGQGGPAAGPGSNGQAAGGAGGDRRGGNSGDSQRDRRKQWTESRDPDQHARRMAYFTAMQQRAKQRGIEMPFHGRP